MMLTNRFYNDLHEQILKVCDDMKLPLHYNKTGDKDFTNMQRVALILLYYHSSHSLDRFLKDLKRGSLWPKYLQLKRIPGKSTLHEWIQKFHSTIIRTLNRMLTSYIQPVLTAIDGTYMKAVHRSRHYEKKMQQQGTIFPKTPPIHVDFWTDVDKKLILDFEIAHHHQHDIIGAYRIFRRNDLTNIQVLADAAYDAEPLHWLIRQKGGTLFAPVRQKKNSTKVRGMYRKKCLNPPYNKGKRSNVESVNSAFKRVYLPQIRAKKQHMITKELA